MEGLVTVLRWLATKIRQSNRTSSGLAQYSWGPDFASHDEIMMMRPC